ncbi:MAG: MFS transporter [Planctomycetota bacterium]
MLLRFSLYGFLKNLRLFEAFLVLALLERGLDFLSIGALISVREVAINLLEIPSGALADALGRKFCMVVAAAAYVVAYLVLGVATSWWLLAVAMAFYGFGDAFRSGTHKAIVYAWLRQQGRADERTRVYGFTRSWSKIGSACSALGGGAMVALGTGYDAVFLASAIPAALNLVNLATYPRGLDRPSGGLAEGVRLAGRHLRAGLAATLRRGPVRGLVLWSAAVEGGYATVKDYVQPLLQTLAVGLVLGGTLGAEQRTGLVVGVVAAAMFLLASAASRRSHRFEERLGGPEPAARALGVTMCAALAALALCLALGLAWPATLLFVALAIGQNLWRPIQVGRFDDHGEEQLAATVLSVESQAKAATAAVLAPAVGALVDVLADGTTPVPVAALWPAPAAAALVLAVAIATSRGRERRGA